MHDCLKILNRQADRRAMVQEATQMSAPEEEDVKKVIAQAFEAVEILARALHVPDIRLQPTLDAIVAHTAAAHPAAQDAGLILLTGGKLVPQATTGRAPQALDAKQQERGEGPCIETARCQSMTYISDTAEEDRWPDICAEAQAHGVASMLCAPLWAGDRTLGALTLYARQPRAFDEHDKRVIEMYATLAALALAGAQRTEQLTEALRNRDLIGQAKGILMERYDLDENAAFGTLTRLSQSLNTKLADIAHQLAETRELPQA
jgi:GAF domain-containing protein